MGLGGERNDRERSVLGELVFLENFQNERLKSSPRVEEIKCIYRILKS